MPFILTSPPPGAGAGRRESVRLWLLGADAPQTAYSPLADIGTDTDGVRFVRPAGSGPVTISVSGSWSPDYPAAAAGASRAAAQYPHEDMDRLAEWLAAGDRLLQVASRRADGSVDVIGNGALSGGGINIRRQRQGEARILDWTVAINMAPTIIPTWRGNRPQRPTPEGPDMEETALAWDDTPTTFLYRSGATHAFVLPGATGGAPPYVYAGVAPARWQLDIATRTISKRNNVIIVGNMTFMWRVTDSAGASLAVQISLQQDTGM